jgi:HSP20 family protein
LDVLIGKVARELATLEEKMDRALERAFGSGMQLPRRGESFRPAIDVYEARDATTVRVDLAGVDSKEIRLIVDGEYLQISGRRTASYDPPPEHHLQMEIPHGHFARVLRMGKPYDPERVTATLKDGILRVELGWKKPATRKIPVESA